MEQNGIWLSLIDYANYREISLSTIRRYIKANRVKHKLESGKYLIFVSDENFQKKELETEKEVLELRLENQRLSKIIKDLNQEIVDIKTLLMMYEGQTSLPEIPATESRELS
jgi:DNA-binding transcriptional MerR regulator